MCGLLRGMCAPSVAVAVLLTGAAVGQERAERRDAQRGELRRPQEERGAQRQRRAERAQRSAAEAAVIPLRHADVEEVGSILSSVFHRDAVIRIDERLEALVVRVPDKQTLAALRDVIAKLDVALEEERETEGAPEHPHFVGVPLEFADAQEVQRNLHSLLRDMDDVRLNADRYANAVWIAGPREAVEYVRGIVVQMDGLSQRAEGEAGAAEHELVFFELEFGDAGHLAGIVNHILADMEAEAQVVADTHANMLVAVLSAREREAVKRMLERLDVPGQREAAKGRPARSHGEERRALRRAKRREASLTP